jgi:hypothetical protein
VSQFRLVFTTEAQDVLKHLESPQYAKKPKKVRKTLGLIQQDPTYRGLRSHKYRSLHGSGGEDVWDSFVENNTPGAWRVFWHDGPAADCITIVTIGPHP